jgi:glycosyltransferase involved in cell wall biosynthesis
MRNDTTSESLFRKEVDSVPVDAPEVSVVVPTFNRRDGVARVLECLWTQTVTRASYEVIIVSDGSSDGTADLVRDFQKRNWQLIFLDLSNRGPAAARNSGARVARGRYLAFTDDDCEPVRDWLEQILRAFRETSVVALQGRTSTDRATRTPLTHEIEVLRPWTSTVPTCNAAYLKRAFEVAGGFDERFPFAHNEDADLAWRVEDLGKIVFVPAVHVIHPPRRDSFAKRARSIRVFQSDFLLYYKNPVKYRRYISKSPWRTIYWKVFVVQQLQFARFCARYMVVTFAPMDFIGGVALLMARWVGLLWYFPQFRRAQVLYRAQMLSRA